ncbi:ATPase, T2SS/T4P/T4SS family [Anaerolentibacter hominis]|uniref:ATPase, T2SS/T4P/T4SS family n=1 Tax=Anaerolentibacter hominis TaxID=3079009 RepID=UPI0031B886CF
MEQKAKLRYALRRCMNADGTSKTRITDFIADILIHRFHLSDEKSLEEILPFEDAERLTGRDKWDILLFQFQRQFGEMALVELLDEMEKAKCNDSTACDCREISEAEVSLFYEQVPVRLAYRDKLDIIVQRIYEQWKGFGVIDRLLELHIDGINGGVSGIPEERAQILHKTVLPWSHECVWILVRGQSVRLSFLGFESYWELIRVCRNLCRFHAGQLSENKGYLVGERPDGTRVAVARPPFSDGWVFFVRKFDVSLQADIGRLITDKGAERVLKTLYLLIRGQGILAITGAQGTGKTTLLAALVHYMPESWHLRVQELSFELHLRRLYPGRNIVSFQETNSIGGQEGLDFQKKTDGTVNILGEVATAQVSSWMVQMAQVASEMTLFTHHAKTGEDLVLSLRNSLLQAGGFSSERAATEQVISVLDFDIHLRKDRSGHRYIERITELTAGEAQGDLTRPMFLCRDIMRFQNGEYRYCNPISEKKAARIMAMLDEEELALFLHSPLKEKGNG